MSRLNEGEFSICHVIPPDILEYIFKFQGCSKETNTIEYVTNNKTSQYIARISESGP